MTTVAAAPGPTDAMVEAGSPTAAAGRAAAPVPAPLYGAQRTLGALAVSLAMFMVVLDTSIANVSIPAISGNLGVSPNQGTWVITSFAVANAITVPLASWLAQRFGQVRLFVAGVLMFVLASWLCGLAPSIEALIAFRVLQGAMAGLLIPLSQTLLLLSYPPAQAGVAMAFFAVTTLVAPVVGPLLGGWITDHIAWPWIFYINVPVGLFSAAMTWSIYRSRDLGPRRVPLDRVGVLLILLWVGALQLMIDTGKDLDWFESPQIIALALVAAVGFVYFVAWELTDRHPVVQLRLFARRNFSLGTAALAVGYGLYFGNAVLLPLWLQQWMGYTATWAGVALAPVGLLAIVLSPWVGHNVGRLDPRALLTVALVGLGGVMWMRSQFTTDASPWVILLPTLLQGAATAFFFLPLHNIIFTGIPPEKVASAAGMSNFLRITAGAFGTSLFTTLWDHRASLHHAQLTEAIHPGNASALQALEQLNRSGLTPQQADAVVNRMIDQQAYTLAALDVFHVSSLLFLALVVLVWFARPQRPAVH